MDIKDGEKIKKQGFKLKDLNSWQSPVGTNNVRFLLTEKLSNNKEKRKKFYYKIELEFINSNGERIRDSIEMTPENAFMMSLFIMLNY